MADDGIQITYEQVGTAITDITSLRRTIEEIFDEFGASVRKVNDAGLRGKGGEGYEQAYNSLKLTFPTFDRALEALADNYKHSNESNQAVDAQVEKLAEEVNSSMANTH